MCRLLGRPQQASAVCGVVCVGWGVCPATVAYPGCVRADRAVGEGRWRPPIHSDWCAPEECNNKVLVAAQTWSQGVVIWLRPPYDHLTHTYKHRATGGVSASDNKSKRPEVDIRIYNGMLSTSYHNIRGFRPPASILAILSTRICCRGQSKKTLQAGPVDAWATLWRGECQHGYTALQQGQPLGRSVLHKGTKCAAPLPVAAWSLGRTVLLTLTARFSDKPMWGNIHTYGSLLPVLCYKWSLCLTPLSGVRVRRCRVGWGRVETGGARCHCARRLLANLRHKEEFRSVNVLSPRRFPRRLGQHSCDVPGLQPDKSF